MGHKVNPNGIRLGISRSWDSVWYARNQDFPQHVAIDVKLRNYIKKNLSHAAVSRIIIERPSKTCRVRVLAARPGIILGRKGEDKDKLRTELQRIAGIPVELNVEEVRKPEIEATLVAEGIAQQLAKRIMFRRAMKRAVGSAMRLGAQGIRVQVSGRLNGAEIARTEWYREGRVPLHTFRADLEFGFAEAMTTYGVIGVKVWILRGDRQAGEHRAA
jgi:small subunit ribosomal protein S3